MTKANRSLKVLDARLRNVLTPFDLIAVGEEQLTQARHLALGDDLPPLRCQIKLLIEIYDAVERGIFVNQVEKPIFVIAQMEDLYRRLRETLFYLGQYLALKTVQRINEPEPFHRKAAGFVPMGDLPKV